MNMNYESGDFAIINGYHPMEPVSTAMIADCQEGWLPMLMMVTNMYILVKHHSCLMIHQYHQLSTIKDR